MLSIVLCAFVTPGAPPASPEVADLSRFPDASAVQAALRANEAVDRYLHAYMVARPWHKDDIQDLIRANERLRATWKELSWAWFFAEAGREEYALYRLQSLKERIGADHYLLGEMPLAGLTWLLPEIP
jgi:hypothetical protein